ncbi:hypothetical protein P3W45_000747 [Vairimorpha bombi]|jgi:formylmethanofuran dehydrogenase subunit E
MTNQNSPENNDMTNPDFITGSETDKNDKMRYSNSEYDYYNLKVADNNFHDMNEYYQYNNGRYYEDQYYDPNMYGNYSPYNNYKIPRETKRKAKQRICSNCSTTSTPSWRRGENGKSLLCNACGLYQKLHGRARPYTVTPSGRTKALKGGYEKTLCVSCNNLYPISEIRGINNAHVCDNCLSHIKNSRTNDYSYNDYQYYKYGNYYNFYVGSAEPGSNVDNTNVDDVNNTIYENLQNDVLPGNNYNEKDA